MKILYFFIILSFLFACSDDVQNKEENQSNANNQQNITPVKNTKLKTYQDTINYALGIVIGTQMQKYGITEIDQKTFNQAVNDAMTIAPQNLQIDPEVAKKIISLYVKNTASQKIVSDLDANQQFLLQNKNKNGIKTLTNGMQYKIITSGSGKTPNLNSKVTVIYTGKLINGDIFVNHQKPVSFIVKNAIQGWKSALLKMKEGDEWIIFLPPELAFGAKGNNKVPPNSVVIYQIKLIQVE
jgi:FKBP-type peptidyl-prolyl cis-trans isomerase FklB